MIYIIIVVLIVTVSIYDALVLKRDINWKDCIHDLLVYMLGMAVMMLVKRSV
jgi:hypothetical protein